MQMALEADSHSHQFVGDLQGQVECELRFHAEFAAMCKVGPSKVPGEIWNSVTAGHPLLEHELHPA